MPKTTKRSKVETEVIDEPIASEEKIPGVENTDTVTAQFSYNPLSVTNSTSKKGMLQDLGNGMLIKHN
jgi:hypothetical protein